MHYFERVCSCLPTGNVSFERKVLPAEYHNSLTTDPEADFWSKSEISLCAFKVTGTGLLVSLLYTTIFANPCTLFFSNSFYYYRFTHLG